MPKNVKKSLKRKRCRAWLLSKNKKYKKTRWPSVKGNELQK